MEGADVGLFDCEGSDRRIENESAPKEYKLNEWTKLNCMARATIRMHLSKSVYYMVQSCPTTYQLWKTQSKKYEKKVNDRMTYFILHLYNLWMKEFDLVHAHLNDMKVLISKFRPRG